MTSLAVEAFDAGRYKDFLQLARDADGQLDLAVIGQLIPGIDLAEVSSVCGPKTSGLYELASVVWDVDERLAISMFREAARDGSTQAQATLGDALNWLGDHEEAATQLRLALDLDIGNRARIEGLLGESLALAGGDADREEIERFLVSGLQDSADFSVPLAQFLLGQGRTAEARYHLERAVDADVYGAALLLGNMLSEDPERHDEAEAAYRHGIASGDAHSAHNLAVMWLVQGKEQCAREMHELAMRMGDMTALE